MRDLAIYLGVRAAGAALVTALLHSVATILHTGMPWWMAAAIGVVLVAFPYELVWTTTSRWVRRTVTRDVLDGLPTPLDLPSIAGILVWEGGVRVAGPLLLIPGRSIDVDHLADAHQHVAAVLAACDHMEQEARRG